MITQAEVMSLDQAQVMSLESNCSRGIIATSPKQKGCGREGFVSVSPLESFYSDNNVIYIHGNFTVPCFFFLFF